MGGVGIEPRQRVKEENINKEKDSKTLSMFFHHCFLNKDKTNRKIIWIGSLVATPLCLLFLLLLAYYVLVSGHVLCTFVPFEFL